ncbi:MAG: DUF4465 domain-containing protein [Paludibacteraceae bacterium]|nr:DUF4465 domain-containing protein [Paludibacteraceae bacterium]
MNRLLLFCFSLAVCSLVHAADTLTLDLPAILDNYMQTPDGYWEDTYAEDVVIEDELFRFSHTGSSDGGGGMAYWEGFTLCTSGDTQNYGKEGDSDAWISRQWGCMAGGGVGKDGKAVPGAPYLVAYWGFSLELLDPDYHSLRVDFLDKKAHLPVGVWICNHPWPYYGNINGDGFASAFSQEGDYFALVAHGLNEKGESTGVTVRFMLAEYTGGALHQSAGWEYMDLSGLGAVNGIYFTMETSDTDALYGANTAVYFCLDRLSVLSAEEEKQPLVRPSGLQAVSAGEDSILLAWNKVAGAEEYLLYAGEEEAGKTTDTCFVFRNLQPLASYTLSVMAVSGKDTSDIASLTASTTDNTAPTVPQGLHAEPELYSIVLTWLPSEDNVEVKRYTVWLNGEAYRQTSSCTCTLVGLEPATEYLLEVSAEDKAGNKSGRAQLRASTLTDSALGDIDADDTDLSVYTIDGKPVGHLLPEKRGVYVLKTKNRQSTIVIN